MNKYKVLSADCKRKIKNRKKRVASTPEKEGKGNNGSLKTRTSLIGSTIFPSLYNDNDSSIICRSSATYFRSWRVIELFPFARLLDSR